MTRVEVLSLTDEELRIKAAELMGFERSCDVLDRINGKMIPQWSRDTEDRNEVAIGVGALPSPHDIAAAYTLGAYAQKLDDEDAQGRTLRMAEFLAWNAGVKRGEWGADPMYALRLVLGHLTALAITRAFILAMTQEES